MTNPNESATQEGQRYFCSKCGYEGTEKEHAGCNYLAYPYPTEGQEKQVEDTRPDALFALHRTNVRLREQVEVMRQALERVRTVDFRTLIEKGDLNGFYKQVDEALDWMRSPNDLSTRTEAGGESRAESMEKALLRIYDWAYGNNPYPDCKIERNTLLQDICEMGLGYWPKHHRLAPTSIRSLREQVEKSLRLIEVELVAAPQPDIQYPQTSLIISTVIEMLNRIAEPLRAALSPSPQK